MRCKWIQKRLLLYLADELTQKESAQVVTHLERCDLCATLLEELAESRDTLKEAIRTTVQPPASMEARILERVQALPARRIPWPARIPAWKPTSVVALSACAALLLMIGYTWGRSNYPSPGGTPETIAARPILNLASLTDALQSWKGQRTTAKTDWKAVAVRLSRQTGLHAPPLELQERFLRLKAGDVLQMNHIPVATLHYDWKGTPVTLAQMDGMRLAPPAALRKMQDHGHCFLIQSRGDLTSILWCEGTENFVLIAHVPPAQLLALACQVSAKLQKAVMEG